MMLLIIVLLVALPLAAWVFFARGRISLQLRRLWHGLRANQLVTWLLVVYGVIVGAFLVTGFYPPTEWLLLGFPVATGVCAGWWEARREPAHSYEGLVAQGVLAGFVATALPVLIMIVGDVWLAWQTGWYVADAEREAMGIPTGWGALLGDLLLWAVLLLAMGVVLGVVGALAGAWLTALPGLPRRGGPQTPSPH